MKSRNAIVVAAAVCSWLNVAVSSERANAVEDQIGAETFASRILDTTDLVLNHHFAPPARQQMVLAAAKALLEKTQQPVTAALSQRISRLATRDELAELLHELWKTATNESDMSHGELQMSALHGLLDSVPGQPNILPATELRVSEQLNANRYVGIGIQVRFDQQQKFAVIDVPFPRGPAYQAGVKPGDLIVAVDGESTAGRSLEEVIGMLRGPEGSAVSVGVRQPDAKQTRTLEMTRGVVPIESVLGYRRTDPETWSYRISDSDPIAYLRIRSVTASTLHELRQAARVIAGQENRALILDLRGHRGVGRIEHVLLIADELIDRGTIGRRRDADGSVQEYAARPDALLSDLPLVVLVNHQTQGDPEFLAASLADNRGATIVGESTAGDPYIRQLIELPDGLGSVPLLVGVLQRGDGRSLITIVSDADSRPGQKRIGLEPNPIVEMSPDQLKQWQKWRHEQDLPEPPSGSTPADPQLDKALELLRRTLQSAT